MRMTVQEVVVDCREPEALARFWGELMGLRWGVVDAGWAVVEPCPIRLAFQQVPEPKSSPKNRLHLDIEVEDLDAASARALALGARVLREPTYDPEGSGFTVLADLEDNEFCFVTDPARTWAATQDHALRP